MTGTRMCLCGPADISTYHPLNITYLTPTSKNTALTTMTSALSMPQGLQILSKKSCRWALISQGLLPLAPSALCRAAVFTHAAFNQSAASSKDNVLHELKDLEQQQE